MGLDITAYRQLQPVKGKHVYDADACYVAGHFRPYNDEGFVERANGLLATRCYTPMLKFHFRAGSYSGYNEWRNHLSLMAQGRPAGKVWADPIGPFAELIDFSDCEGTIGPVVAAKLLDDFRAYHDKAKAYGEWFRELYEYWMKAFVMAADNGAVAFH